MRKAKPKLAARRRKGFVWKRHKDDWYRESPLAAGAIFKVEKFSAVWDGCCGKGNIVDAAVKRGYRKAQGSDLRNRARGRFQVLDFFDADPTHAPAKKWDLVSNPPFSKAAKIVAHAFAIGASKVAIILPTKRLNAIWSWAIPLGLRRIWFLTPRENMLPGNEKRFREEQRERKRRGLKNGGGSIDYVWLVFSRDETSPHEFGWVHRDRGPILAKIG